MGSETERDGVRVAVVWCPDWPVVAHRCVGEAVVVVHANRVVAASIVARAHGVVRGLRRREAQSRCAEVVVLERDPGLEARMFESVVGALDDLTPRTEIVRPGLVVFPTRGPSRYFGGDVAMAQRCRVVVDDALRRDGLIEEESPTRIGVADSVFGATVAARTRTLGGDGVENSAITVVADGQTAAFLAPRSIRLLDRRDLVEVCVRLGLHTLGAFAALDPVDVAGRFGTEGVEAHRLAAGLDLGPPVLADPPPEMEVAAELDPPVERVDQAAFMGKALADELLVRLDARGASCTRVVIAAETEHGEELCRHWRHEGSLTAAAIADRVRWQLDGWLNGSSARRPTGGITRLSVRPEDLGAATGRQLGFWGGRSENVDVVARAVARVQGLLGSEAVRVPEARAGRSPQEQVITVPADAVDLGRATIATAVSGADPHGASLGEAPWPGSLPGPPPVRVHDPAIPVVVLDARGHVVTVDARAQLSGNPATVAVDGAPALAVRSWAGPWPLDERWWDSQRQRRRARLQMLADDGVARLVVIEGGRWWVEATYD